MIAITRITIAAFFVATLSGCSPVTRAQDTLKQAGSEIGICNANVYHNPDYESLMPHFVSKENGYQPTMAQLADSTRPTKEESRLLIKYQADFMPCRQAFVQKIQILTPMVAQAYSEGWAENDQIMAKLSERKLTWGEAAQQRQQNALTTKMKVAAATRYQMALYQQENLRWMRAAEALNESNMQQADEPLQFPHVEPFVNQPVQMNIDHSSPYDPEAYLQSQEQQKHRPGDGLNPNAPYVPGAPCIPYLGQDCR